MNLFFTPEHEWILVGDDGTATIGITDHAQAELGDVVFVEFPAIGSVLAIGSSAGVVESTKAVSDLYCPVAGTVSEVNAALAEDPTIVNADPQGAGWFFKLTGVDATAIGAAIDGLMDQPAYAAYLETL